MATTTALQAQHTAISSIMAELTFGIEIETEGAAIKAVAQKVADTFGWTIDCGFGYLSSDKCTVKMPDGRDWTFMRDGSLQGGGCEVVSPICKLEDMEAVQGVIRAVRASGAKVNERCGLHIHVGGIPRDNTGAKACARLLGLMRRYERMIERAVGRGESHQGYRFCQRVDQTVERTAAEMGTRMTLADLGQVWFGESRITTSRYDHSRYHGLNLNSWFYRGTVEFRYFASTLHAGEVRSLVTLCLGIVAYAKWSKRNSKRTAAAEVADKELMRRLAQLYIGIKDETVLNHLTKKLVPQAQAQQAA